MSYPKGLMGWAVWCQLDECNDIKMVLLKGHLILDSLLSDLSGDKNMSFHGKTKKLAHTNVYSAFIESSLLTINSLRNKLAHELDFDVRNSELLTLAERILDELPYAVSFRRSFRTKIIHAFAALADELYSLKHHIKQKNA